MPISHPRRLSPSRVFRLLPRSGERALREVQRRFHLMRRDQRGGLGKKFVVTGFGLGMRHMELVLQAEKLGMLNRDVLRKSGSVGEQT